MARAVSHPVVIYTHRAGRFGNHLLRFVHWIAWVSAHQAEQVTVVNTSFWPYARLFARWKQSPGCGFPAHEDILSGTARTVGWLPPPLRDLGWKGVPRLIDFCGSTRHRWRLVALDDTAGESLDLEESHFIEEVQARSVTVCRGWKISSWSNVQKYRSALRDYFVPDSEMRRGSENFISGVRKKADVVVGLLIRQTDYREWHDGRFLYPTQAYVGWVRQLHELFAGKRVAVVIASDERQDESQFEGLNCTFATGSVNRGGHWFESFLQLGLCDFIISPPSTFTAGAAFVGNIGLLPLGHSEQKLDLGDILKDGYNDAARHPVFSLAVK